MKTFLPCILILSTAFATSTAHAYAVTETRDRPATISFERGQPMEFKYATPPAVAKGGGGDTDPADAGDLLYTRLTTDPADAGGLLQARAVVNPLKKYS